MTHSYSIDEAKTNLSRLVAMAESGEPVELRRGREPVARLVALPRRGAARRRPGAMAGRIEVDADSEVLPADVERALGMRD